MTEEARDYVTIQDEQGQEKEYAIEALFDMDDKTYALLASGEETVVMRVEGTEEDQYLVGITDSAELESILDAYQIAVKAAPVE